MGDNSLSKREGRKIYLDISVFNDNASVNMLDYISVIIDSIPVNDIKLKYPDNPAKQIDEFVNQYMKKVCDTPGAVSRKLIEKQVELCDMISDLLARRVCDGGSDIDLFFRDPIEDFDSFFLPIRISLNIFNATRFLVRDLADIYTISTISIMNIINKFELRETDRELRFNLLKIVGRKNDYDLCYVGIKELELDYKLYYQRNIVESTLTILNIDIKTVVDAYTAATITNEENSLVVKDMLEGLYSKNEIDDIIESESIFIADKVIALSNDITLALNRNEYKMTPLCYDILEMCLAKYDNIQIFKHNSGIYETAWDYEEVVEDCKGLIREYLSLLGVEV